ncbi:hypothetical protein PUN28_009706 [Cardiocondyla obscurior]|uniref:Uncharacterized protein n=1 Tax=Cardiocondyla obscurior TaxID=286306 RepID=A0AAW2FU56_9HYME
MRNKYDNDKHLLPIISRCLSCRRKLSVPFLASSKSIMLRKLVSAAVFCTLIIMLQASPVTEDSDENDYSILLSTVLALLSPDQFSLNQIINNLMKLRGMRLPCMIHSIVPWEFNCTQIK